MADWPLVYEDWTGLLSDLTAMDTLYTNDTQLNRQRTILHLVRSLRQYGEGQFRFFIDGFAPLLFFTPPNPPLFPMLELNQSDPLLHSNAVLEQIHDNIKLDTELIVAAVTDRQKSDADGILLGRYDQLAAGVLWPAGPRGNEGDPNVGSGQNEGLTYNTDFRVKTLLTYFHAEHKANIRILPYSQVAMIGVPIEAKENLTKLLAIPHEVGHFLYWYSFCDNWSDDTESCLAQDGQPTSFWNVRERFGLYIPKSQDEPTWSEEIFADAFGVLSGGPLAALTLQDLALGDDNKSIFSVLATTDVHPTPLIRPLIQLRAMSHFTDRLVNPEFRDEWNRVIELLYIRWSEKIGQLKFEYNVKERRFTSAQWQNAVSAKLSSGSGLSSLTHPVDRQIENAIRGLEALFNALGAAPINGWGWATRVNSNWSSMADLEAMLSQSDPEVTRRPLWKLLEMTLPNMDEKSVDLLNSYNDPLSKNRVPPLWEDWVLHAKSYLDDLTTGPIPCGTMQNMQDKDKGHWIRVYGASGWATKGPCVIPGN